MNINFVGKKALQYFFNKCKAFFELKSKKAYSMNDNMDDADLYPNVVAVHNYVVGKIDKIQTHSYWTEITEELDAHATYEIPAYYEVGNESLKVFYCGEKLILGKHYQEEGTEGEVSNLISFNFSIGNINMNNIAGFEDFMETLEFVIDKEYIQLKR